MHMHTHGLILSNIILMLKYVSSFIPCSQGYGLFLVYSQLSFFPSNPLLSSSLHSEKVLITVITVFLSVGATSAHITLLTA